MANRVSAVKKRLTGFMMAGIELEISRLGGGLKQEVMNSMKSNQIETNERGGGVVGCSRLGGVR